MIDDDLEQFSVEVCIVRHNALCVLPEVALGVVPLRGDGVVYRIHAEAEIFVLGHFSSANEREESVLHVGDEGLAGLLRVGPENGGDVDRGIGDSGTLVRSHVRVDVRHKVVADIVGQVLDRAHGPDV